MSADREERSPHDVVVVGAGPTGLTAAGLLGRRGLRVLVVERDSAPHLLPRAVHLDDEVLRVFTGMGLGGRVRAISTPGQGLRLVTRDGTVLVEFPRDPTGGADGLPGANMFHQPDLEAVLRADVDRLAGVELRSGVRVVAVRQPGPDRVEVELDDGSTVPARAVLACDGAGSPVRHQLGIGMVELGRPSTWLVVDVGTTAELDEWPGVHQVCDASRAATFMRVGPLRYRWEFALRPGETAAEATAPAVLAGLLAPWLDRAPHIGWTVERSTSYTYRARVAERWRDGRVSLLGDAAHQTPPFLGQGLCAGIRDAANLEWKLALVLRGAGDDLLDTYEAERRPHATTVIRTAAALGRVMSARGVPASVLRSGVLRAAARVPGLPERVAERAWPPLRPGPLVQRARFGRGVAGQLCPTPEVQTLGGTRRLDDVLGRGFAVLTTAAGGHVPGVCVVRLVDRAPARPGEVCDPTDGLARWLRGGAVLVRPDHTVLWQGTDWPAALRRAGLVPAGLT